LMTERLNEAGFTLLEVLVSLTVFALLMVGLDHGLRTGLDLWNAQSRQMNGTAELDSTFRVLRILLTDIPRNPATPINSRGGSDAISFEGTTDHIAFVGDLPTGLGDSRRADITLQLREERLILAWRPHRHETASTEQPVIDSNLLDGVSRLEFAYFGVAAPGSPAEWLTEWAGPTLPELIRIRVSLRKAAAHRWPDVLVAPQLATPKA
jgi:general secretion pathway protein J